MRERFRLFWRRMADGCAGGGRRFAPLGARMHCWTHRGPDQPRSHRWSCVIESESSLRTAEAWRHHRPARFLFSQARFDKGHRSAAQFPRAGMDYAFASRKVLDSLACRSDHFHHIPQIRPWRKWSTSPDPGVPRPPDRTLSSVASAGRPVNIKRPFHGAPRHDQCGDKPSRGGCRRWRRRNVLVCERGAVGTTTSCPTCAAGIMRETGRRWFRLERHRSSFRAAGTIRAPARACPSFPGGGGRGRLRPVH